MQVPNFQIAFGAFMRGICALFASKVYVRELAQKKPTEASYRLSWV